MSIRSTRPGARVALLTCVALLGCAVRVPDAPASPAAWSYARNSKAAVGRHGMVVTDAPLATEAGLETLRRGGNAVDAAVATALALAVVLPAAGNLGGGGFIVMQVEGRALALDFRETAPAAASRDMYLDERGEPAERSLTGPLAAGVPGSVAGLWEAHRRFGRTSWAELVEHALVLARDGFTIEADVAEALSDDAQRLARYAGSAAAFLPAGRPLEVGARWRSPDLARTLERLAAAGAEGFYRGETAALIVAEMERGGGIITAEDLARYRPVWREPIEFRYRGHRVLSMPPPSSGGLALALTAGQLERFDLRALGWHSARAIHLEVEALRRAFAVRNHVLGDPDFVEIPLVRLLSPEFVAELGASISLEHATPSADIASDVGAVGEGRHTTHLSVADGEGNVVALTTTLNGSHGSAVTVEGAGFLLNNEMDDFTVAPGKPNQFGLVQGEANAIEPGKRMLSSMAPTIVLDADGKALLVTGASGGGHIISSTFEILSNRLDYGLGVAESLGAPRFHHQHLPDEIALERGGFEPGTARALEALGHRLRWFEPRHGSLAATIERRDGAWDGASDPRTHGLARGD